MLFGEEGKLFSLQQQNEGCKTIQNLVDKKILLLLENYFFFMNVKLWVLVATFFSINFKLRRCFQKMDLYVIALLALLFSSKKNWKLKTFLITFTSKSFEMCTLLYTKWMNEFSFKKENEVTKRMKT